MGGFKKQALVYGLAIGLNRGSMLIFMPPIVALLGVKDYGLYSYIIALVFFLAPLISLNISAAIVREGADDISKATYIQRKSNIYILIIGLILAGLFELINSYYYFAPFIGMTILMATVEALSNGLLAHFRAKEEHYIYLIYSFLKISLFLSSIYLLKGVNHLNLENMIIAQVLVNSLLYFSFAFKVLFKEKVTSVAMKPILIFTSLLLPHTLSQWLMNASNRVVIKHLIGEKELGVFSIAFSLASIGMILNSGISLVIPQHMIKSYNKWISPNFAKRFYVYYSLLFIGFYITILGGIYIDMNYSHIVKFYDKYVILYFTLIYLGFYFLGYYYYYSNVLFYNRNSALISKVTVITSFLSIGITILLTYILGTIGAAIGSLITYILYAVFIFFASVKIEPILKAKSFHLVFLGLISMTVVILISLLFNKLFF